MGMQLKNLGSWIGACVRALAAPGWAEGSSIKLYDGTTTLIIADGSPLDSDAGTGTVKYVGTLGVWSLDLFGSVIVADGKEELYVHDFSASSNSASASTLTIWFSDLSSGPKGPTAEASIGGLTAGTVTYQTYKGTALFDETTLLNSMSFPKGAFSGTDTDTFTALGGEYSWTSKITITHLAGASVKKTSFDASVTVPDGGTTLSLLGLSLLGIVGAGRFTRASRI